VDLTCSSSRSFRRVVACTCLTLLLLPITGRAFERHPANVPPGDEIEILDPNADPLGRPAVELKQNVNGRLEVVIPPVVLVHKYYYTGDRSFQAQLLPGGPTIIVCSHPRTGERCYIETNMMPGAPRVTYKGHEIVYDFGEHGMTIDFPAFGSPKVCYRSGLPVYRKVGNLIHADQIKEHAATLKQQAKIVHSKSCACVAEFAIDSHQLVDDALLPVKQIIRYVPMASTWFDPDREQVQAEKIANHKRAKEAERFQKQGVLDQLTVPTVR
jgi:hypothetical protein